MNRNQLAGSPLLSMFDRTVWLVIDYRTICQIGPVRWRILVMRFYRKLSVIIEVVASAAVLNVEFR
jgi:hypothetical protein